MGVGYIAENIRRNSFTVDFVDINRILLNSANETEIEYWQPQYWHYWWEHSLFEIWFTQFKNRIERLSDLIIDSGNKLFGFSVTRQSWMLSVKLAEKIKKELPDSTILFGGYDCQFVDECLNKYSSSTIDYVIIDEAEQTIVDFLNEYYNGKKLNNILNIPGVLSLSRPEKYIRREWIKNLDSINFPTYKEVDISIYPANLSVMIMGSRCCSWAKCSICPDTNRGGFFRTRSAKHIFEEIIYLYQNFNIKDFVFGDAEINGAPEILDELCGLIIESGIKIKLGGQLRVNPEIEVSTYEKMKSAGFNILLVGLENGSPNVIKIMNKGFKLDDAVAMFTKMKLAGLMVAINLIVGTPGETLDNFYETVNFIRNRRDIIDHIEELNTCMVYKKCKLGEKYKSFKVYNNCDEYAWFRKDGNTITERRRRLTVLSNIIDELNYGRGYKWKKYDSNVV